MVFTMNSSHKPDPPNPIYFFEDFPVGKNWIIGTHTFTKNEIFEFATQYDPQSFHVNEEQALLSPYNGIIASGWHTCSVIMRLNCDNYLLNTAALGSPGLSEIKWLAPVYPKDTIQGAVTILESRLSVSKPNRGSIVFLWTGENQKGVSVVSIKGVLMLKCRPAKINS